jgi:hypothetical protein
MLLSSIAHRVSEADITEIRTPLRSISDELEHMLDVVASRKENDIKVCKLGI